MGRLRLREYSVSPFQLLYRKSEKSRRAAYAFVRMFVVPRNRCNFKLNLALLFTGGISAIPHFRGLSALLCAHRKFSRLGNMVESRDRL